MSGQVAAPRWRRFLTPFGRLGWGVADQAVSSLENFVLGVFVARTLGAQSLGALGVCLLTYALIVNLSRGLATDPLMVRFSGAAPREWESAAPQSTGTALWAGSIAGLGCLAFGCSALWLVGGSELGWGFVILGIAMPGLVLQDAWRYVFFAAGNGAKAFTNDVVWTLLLLCTLIAGSAVGFTGLGWVIAAFGTTATLAALFGVFQSRVHPSMRSTPTWLRRHRDLGPRFLLENFTLGAAGPARSFMVAAAAGLVAVGAIRGAEMVVGPVMALLMGIAQVAVPEAARSLREGRAALRRLCVVLSLGLASVSVAWAVLVLTILPLGMGKLVLGDVWPEAKPLLLAVLVSATAGCLHVGASAGVRAFGRADLSMRAQMIVSGAYIVFGGLGALLAGAPGTVWGTPFASVATVAVWWRYLLRAEQEHARDHDTGSAEATETVVLICTIMRPVGGSGVQSHVQTFAEHLKESGRSYELVTPFSLPSPLLWVVFGVRRVIRVFNKPASVWWYRHWHGKLLEWALRRRLCNLRTEVVLYAQCPVSANAALRARSTEPVTMAVHFNVSQADEWAEAGEIARGGASFRAIRLFESTVISRLDGLVYVSEFMKTSVEARIPAAVNVLATVIPNAVRIEPAPRRGRAGDLLTIGSLEPRKNHRYLLEVLAEATQRGRPFALTVIGDGPDRGELETYAATLGISEHVRFLGYVPEVRPVLRAHAVYCHTSTMESFGISLVEAMAEGLPVLTSAVGGTVEIVEPGRTGLFWPLDDAGAAADLLVSLMDSPARRNEMGREGRKRASRNYSPDALGARLAQFLIEMSGACGDQPIAGSYGLRAGPGQDCVPHAH